MGVATAKKFIDWQIWITQDPYSSRWVMHSPNFGVAQTCFADKDFYFCKAMVVNKVTEIINMQKNGQIPDTEMKPNDRVGPVPALYRSIPAKSL